MSRSEIRQQIGQTQIALEAAKACQWYVSVRDLNLQLDDLKLRLEEAPASLKERLSEGF